MKINNLNAECPGQEVRILTIKFSKRHQYVITFWRMLLEKSQLLSFVGQAHHQKSLADVGATSPPEAEGPTWFLQ
jgi:hypothetical protein